MEIRNLYALAQQQNIANLLMNADSHAQSQYYQRISYAMSKWAQLGYADQEVAGTLGVAPGTPTSDQSYSDWSSAFSEQQYNHQLEEQARAKAAAEIQEKLAAVTVKPARAAATTNDLADAPVTYESARAYAQQHGKNGPMSEAEWEGMTSKRSGHLPEYNWNGDKMPYEEYLRQYVNAIG